MAVGRCFASFVEQASVGRAVVPETLGLHQVGQPGVCDRTEALSPLHVALWGAAGSQEGSV